MKSVFSVSRLQIAVNNCFLMRVLHRGAGLDEKFKAMPHRKLTGVGECRDRFAADVFHHEIGPPALGRAGFEHAGDVGMIHQRQGLSLRFEPRDHLARVHAQLDDLDGDDAMNRRALLGFVNAPHAAFADQRENRVRANLLWVFQPAHGGRDVCQLRGGVRSVLNRGLNARGLIALARWLALGGYRDACSVFGAVVVVVVGVRAASSADQRTASSG